LPHRAGRNSSPEEFAKDLARRLAATPPPPDPGFSWRDSVVVGRLISGGAVALFAVVLVGLVFSGVGWVMRGDGEIEPEVLSANIGTSAETPSTTTGDSAISDDVESFTTMPGELFPPPMADDPSGVTPVTLPEATTTSTTGSGETSTTAATATSTSVATTQPPASSTSTIAPPQTTTTVATPTTPPPPTTTLPPSTTTTVEDTTTTTIQDTTTTTCGNNGQGRGNC
jgi:hypothetical protein